MSCKPAVSVNNLNKCYQIYSQPNDRLKQFLWRNRRQFYREFWALRDINFEVMPGEVFGIIGRNGSGKSTLLQLVCGTMTPSSGEVNINGRVTALLELGAGFNPEFSGRENIWMSALILGLSEPEIAQRYEEIVEFSGIREFIDQPVKTYSSGMYVRLAFAVATSVDPDILVIDEALSVGDGAFARKSFDRIMALRDAGKTILFCSHSMYQIDVLCQRALWLERGTMRMLDLAGRTTSSYNTALALESELAMTSSSRESVKEKGSESSGEPPSPGRIIRVYGTCAEANGTRLAVKSQASTLSVTVEFVLDPALPNPSVALGIENAAGVSVSSVISTGNTTAITRDGNGRGQATVVFPEIPLLKGEYRVTAFLGCELGLHVYDFAPQCLILDVSQEGVDQGLVALPHRWQLTT